MSVPQWGRAYPSTGCMRAGSQSEVMVPTDTIGYLHPDPVTARVHPAEAPPLPVTPPARARAASSHWS